ncbi:MAG: FAD-dependent oxidoreductase [Vicinamibacterales bacterium]
MSTRRTFLKRMAQVGGARAVYLGMQGLGLTPAQAAASPLAGAPLAPGSGTGASVVVIGGGIAGLVSAWELQKAGYTVTVLEARTRPGGRNWTVRGGTTVAFTDGTAQTCAFTDGYLNAGPARIPSIHHALLSYCHELGVRLEVEVNMSRSARLQNDDAFGGRPVEMRQAVNDTRGWVSELLAKAIDHHALDAQFAAADRDRLVAFLRAYGDLSGDLSYKGSGRSGFTVHPGAAGQSAERRDPLPLDELIDSEFVGQMLFDESLDMQATMFQPVGGMDRIPYAFADKLRGAIRYGAVVTELGKTDHGVRVSYKDGEGRAQQVTADYGVCTMPPPHLARIKTDLSPAFGKAIADIRYASAYKIGWESRRFWEQEDGIYGGISFIKNHPVTLIWYPSDRMHTERGVLVSGYSGETGSGMAAISTLDGKLAASREAVEKVHPGRGRELQKPVFVSWARVPFSEGSWVNRGLGPDGTPYCEGPYLQLQQPDDRIFFAGDYLAQVGAWQEGAVLSAQRTVSLIAERQRQTSIAR